MKRPRRPPPRKARKRAPRPKKVLTFDLAKPRKDFAIQWAPFPVDKADADILAQYTEAGWKPVKRCRGFKSKRGKIIFQNSILLEIPLARQREMATADTMRAKKQIRDASELFNLNGQGDSRRYATGPWPLVPNSFITSAAYETVTADVEAVDVEVKVKLRLSRRFQDAAAALKLTLEQYAQYRMTLYVRGDLGGLLLPVDPSGADALELHESGQITLSSRI